MPAFFSNFARLQITGIPRLLWLAFLIVATIGLSAAFKCAMPFAALAAMAALTLPRKETIAFIMTAWAANQFVGFAFLGYPTDSMTLQWGAIMGVCAFMSAIAASFMAKHSEGHAAITGIAVTFIAAFIGFQGTLLLGNLYMLGGLEAFTLASKIYIAKLNIAALVGLWLVNRIAAKAGVLPASQPDTVTA